MSPGTRRSRVPLVVGSVIIVLLLSGSFFLPEIAATYWHVRFGNSAIFHEWKVPVPKDWCAFTRDDLLIIQKPVRFYDNEEAPTISVGLFHPGNTLDPKVLNEAIIQVNSKKGYIFQEDKQIQIGADAGYCLLFSRGKGQMNININCYSSTGRLSLDFFSRGSEIQTFYAVLGEISRLDTQPTRIP